MIELNKSISVDKIKLRLNFLAFVAVRATKVLDQVFLIPFFIAAWGTELYGEWLLVATIPSFLSFGEGGVGLAIQNGFTTEFSGGNRDRSAQIFRSGLLALKVAASGMIFVSVAIGLATEYYEPVRNFLLPTGSLLRHPGVVFIILCAVRISQFFHPLIDTVYVCERRAHFGQNIKTIQQLVEFFLSILMLLLGAGPIIIASGLLCSVLVFEIFFLRISFRKLDAWLPSINTVKVDRATVFELLKKGFYYLGHQGWQIVYFQGMTLVVGNVLGGVAVVAYNTARTLSRTAVQLTNILGSAVGPELQYLLSQGDIRQVKKLYWRTVFSTLIVSIFATIALFFGASHIYRYWLAGRLEFQAELFLPLLVAIVPAALSWPAVVLHFSANRPEMTAVSGIILASIALIFLRISGSFLGLLAPGVAAVIFEISFFVVLTISVNRLFRQCEKG